MNYAWKRWQMFTTLAKIIKSVDETGMTGIDHKMLKLCERFIEEEELILKYSSENQVPKQLAKDQIHIEKKLEWKHRMEEISDMYGQAANTAAAQSMQMEQYRSQIEQLSKQNRDLLSKF